VRTSNITMEIVVFVGTTADIRTRDLQNVI
jgi:hypothetical protein